MSSLVYVWDHVTPRSGTSMEAVTVTGSSHLLTWEIMPIHSYDKHNVISWKELVVLVIVISVGLPTLIRLQKQNMKHFPESLGWIKTTSSNLLRLIWKDPWEIPSTVSIIINTFGSLQSRHILLCERFRRWSDRELRRVKKNSKEVVDGSLVLARPSSHSFPVALQVSRAFVKKNVCSAGYTFSLNVIGSSTKFILHVIVLQSSLIEQPSLSWVWDIPEHEPPEYSAI